MSTEYLPAPAPAATPRKPSGWIVAGLIIAGLLIFGAVSNATEDHPSSTSSTVTSDGGLTPATMTDSLPASTIADFCSSYNALDNEAVAHEIWIEQYNSELAGTPGIPSADALYYELTSRC